MIDIAHLLRPGHLQQLRNILDDKEASTNDKFVALELLKNANVASGGRASDVAASKQKPGIWGTCMWMSSDCLLQLLKNANHRASCGPWGRKKSKWAA